MVDQKTNITLLDKPDESDDRFLPTIVDFTADLKELGFSNVTQLEDGTYSVGAYDEKKYGKTVIIPEEVFVIQADTFKGNQMTWIVIPATVRDYAGLTATGAAKVVYYFVGTTTETKDTLKCSAIYQVEGVGWHFENGEPKAGPGPVRGQ